MSQKYVKPPLSPSFTENRLSPSTTPKSSTSSSIQHPPREFTSAFDSYLNRNSVAFLVSGTVDTNQSTEANSKSPVLGQDRLTQIELYGESHPAVISHEVPPNNMRDVAQILSTLRDKVPPPSSRMLQHCICKNRDSGFLNNYWRTVLDCTFCEKKAQVNRVIENHDSTSIGQVSRPTRSLGAIGRISKEHRCSDCGGTFKQRGALVSHIRGVHQLLRPYSCDIEDCTAAYKYRGDLNRHKAAIHRKIKPFPCALCGIPFARKSVRDRHARKKHG